MVVIRKTDKVKEIENDLLPISLTSILSKTVDYFVADWIMLQLTLVVYLSFIICMDPPTNMINLIPYHVEIQLVS